jgi:hypothetical protein
MNKKLIFALVSGIAILLAFVVSVSLRRSDMTNRAEDNAPSVIANSTPSQVIASTTPAPRQLPLQAEYHVNLPNGIMFVDSLGRRTGKDPATGTIYREIPGTSYAEDCLSKNANCAGELFTNNLPDGQYTFYVLGGVSGKYGLSVYNNRGLSQVFRGDIQLGTMVAYAQDYQAAHFASSTLSFQGTVSSTASITAEPPHNLLLPPVPGQ